MNFLSSKPLFSSGMLAASISAVCTAYAADSIQEVVVTAEFHQKSLLALSNSVSVMDAQTIRARGATHLEQLLPIVPNVNFSSGASRGRFFQIRGIGERSQFVNPVNPSVGLLVDGIDFTGLGLAASMLDIEQVEVFRGPQGTLLGANALAGLIHFQSAAPTQVFEGRVGVELAEYDKRVVNGTVSGPLSERLGYRLAFQAEQSNGYIDNEFLNRDDTSNIDEQILRGSLHYQVSDDLRVELVGYYLNADNGYDDFSLTNTRKTGSDQPGTDAQESFAGAMKVIWQGAETFDAELLLSGLDADLEYGFDEDWSYVGEFDAGLFPYSSADSYLRERENISVDLRFSSKAGHEIFDGSTRWTLGFYGRDEQESLNRRRFADLLPDGEFESLYETRNFAVYGQLDSDLGEGWSLVAGLRAERRNADYEDSAGVERDRSDTFWGGRIALNKQLSDEVMVYGLLSRGYKAGGVNAQIISASLTNNAITPAIFFFDEEILLNYELGLKGRFLDGALQLQLSAFYQDRNDLQAKQSVFNAGDFSFDDYFTNADGGSQGIELEYHYQASDSLALFGSLGLLDAEFDDFVSVAHVDSQADPANPISLDSRDVAHAPNYQFLIGAEWLLTEQLFARLEIEGKDAFYFSNTHDEKSDSYELLHLRVGYRADNWQVSVWGRNLTDEDVEVRGFYFSHFYGNNPGNGYAPETYTQFGEPRVLGVSAEYQF
jgi:outer membrane receptor protein involved in Fe transport